MSETTDVAAAAGNSRGVAEPCAAYKTLTDKWEVITTLLGGTEVMRKAGEKYLPKAVKETDAAYMVRRYQSFLFGGYKRILGSLAGKPFKRSVSIGEDVPPVIVPLLENVDQRGAQLNVFANDLFNSLLKFGSVHVLVDFPAVEAMDNRAQELARAARPYWVMVEASDLIGWRHEFVDGKPRLAQVRIHERVTEFSGDFQEKQVDQIRVLVPGEYFLFRKNDDGEWDVHDNGAYTLDEIPLVTIRARSRDLMIAEPPLMPVAELNVAHWQSQSDQRNILHVVRCPILMGAGFTDEGDLDVGPNTMVTVRDPQASLRYVEHGGSAIKAGQDDLDAIEEKMAAMGLELLRPPQPMTATQAEIDNAGNEAELVTLAHMLEDGIENALGLTAMWLGMPREVGGSVEVYKDFVSEISRDTDITNLISVRANGDISRGTLLSELKRRGVFQDDFDPLAEDDAIANESMMQSQLEAAINPQPEIDPATGLPLDQGGAPGDQSGSDQAA